ncbi:hypothetical protein BJV78DRAFT_1236451 [Lactifluus subvellereus]|nr:hypothetical protein BJV78DRAFT_1236451 [Lactifluus subvellereus]
MARKKSWQNLLENDVFLKQIPADPLSLRRVCISDASVGVTVQAWNSPFQGNAAEVLLMTIADYLDKRRVVYARHTSIVNSSGTGKSRAADQVARKIITVPMCLREDGSQGFPPPDVALRGWLSSVRNPNEVNEQVAVAQRLHGFVYSLLTVTFDYLVAIESERDDIPALPTITDDQINNLSQAEWHEQELLVKARQEKLAIAFHDGGAINSNSKFLPSNLL